MTELETAMIAKSLIFLKVYALPKSRMSAFKDRLVNIPITDADVRNTLNALPRTPTEAGIAHVNLKRKKSYKNSHIWQFVKFSNCKSAPID